MPIARCSRAILRMMAPRAHNREPCGRLAALVEALQGEGSLELVWLPCLSAAVTQFTDNPEPKGRSS